MGRTKTRRRGTPAAAGSVAVAPAGPSVAAAAAAHGPSPGWIINPLWDSLLFIGAPLVCMAGLLPLRAVFSPQQIAVFLLAFFTFGHHFPGFLRAYGDRDLFERFQWRFLLAPPLLFAASLWFDARELHGLLIFVAAWDIWHVLMQHYGFMRIYDAKQGAISPLTSRLDWALSITWYITLIVASPHYRHSLLSRAYATGLPILSADVFQIIQTTLIALTALLTLAYIGYHLNLWRGGRPVSLRKLAALLIFLGATYYLYVYIDDFLVGFTVWSAFHCIQYYGIVWVFNRNRVERGGRVFGFMRMLFRPRAGLVLFYVALIFAYGSLNYWISFVSEESLRRLLLAFVFTSNALHYYYDGFIWKVREPDTRKHLDIAAAETVKPGIAAVSSAGAAKSGARVALPGLARGADFASAAHRVAGWTRRPAWVQTGYLCLIVVGLAALETSRSHNTLAVMQSLAEVSPEVGDARLEFGNALAAEGRLDEALSEFEVAARLLPESSEVYNNRGSALMGLGRLEDAMAEYRKALEISLREHGSAEQISSSPLLPGGRTTYASDRAELHNNLGDALSRLGRREEATEQFRSALAVNPDSVQARTNLGATLAEMGRFDEGKRELEQSLRIAPGFAGAHMNLAAILAYEGRHEQALFHYTEAIRNGDDDSRQAAQAAIAELRGQRQ